jgi:hypothetical protein
MILLNDRDIRSPTNFLFSSLNWMPIRDLYMYKKVVFLFKVLYTQMPNYLNMFRFIGDVSCRQTRSNDFTTNILYLSRAKTENFKRSFSYSCAFLWNKLSQNVRNSSSIGVFKSVYLMEYFSARNS